MSGNSERNRMILRCEGVYRRIFMKYFANKTQSILLSEYPKSGGSWLSLMVSDALGLSFPRNEFPRDRNCFFQGHYLTDFGLKQKIILWRDPRDIVVSYYYHSVVGNTHSSPSLIKETRQAIGADIPDDINKNLNAFIHYLFSGEMSPRFTWNDFFDQWWGKASCCHVSYESLKSEPQVQLARILDELGFEADAEQLMRVVEKYSFERMSGRKTEPQNTVSFVRKGVVGDWVNYFSSEDEALLMHLVENRLTLAGYS